MSTDYYIACETCQECYWIGQDGWKFFTFYSGEVNCMKGIGEFIGKHVLHEGQDLKILSENRVEEFKKIKWPKDGELDEGKGE